MTRICIVALALFFSNTTFAQDNLIASFGKDRNERSSLSEVIYNPPTSVLKIEVIPSEKIDGMDTDTVYVVLTVTVYVNRIWVNVSPANVEKSKRAYTIYGKAVLGQATQAEIFKGPHPKYLFCIPKGMIRSFGGEAILSVTTANMNRPKAEYNWVNYYNLTHNHTERLVTRPGQQRFNTRKVKAQLAQIRDRIAKKD